MNNVPKLRFSGFNSEWESKRLGDFIEERSEKTEDKENYPLYSLTIENGVVPKSDRYEREFLVKKEGNFKIVEPNDFVYNPMNLRFGALAVYKGEIPVSVSGYYNVFNFKGESVSEFWSNYLKTDRMFYLYNTIATGSLEEKKRVHYSQFKELNLKMPIKEEQEKIANFLTKVDKLIEKQDEKVSNLEQYKKGMMQKIFSQEIRFKKEDGGEYPTWETAKLGNVCSVIMGQSPNSEFYNEEFNGIPLIQGNADMKNRKTSPRMYTTSITKSCEIGDIIMSVRAPAGTIAKSEHEACIGRGVCAIRTKERNDFIYQLLLIQEDKWSKFSQGSTFDSINSSDINDLKVSMPCNEEQDKIAKFLAKIDSIVDKEKEKLEELRVWKKGLLKGMFA